LSAKKLTPIALAIAKQVADWVRLRIKAPIIFLLLRGRGDSDRAPYGRRSAQRISDLF
jgi:hypothetical protein